MKKTDEKIILYLDNQLSGKEKEDFEKELEESAELREKVEAIKTGLLKLKSYSSTAVVDESYFQSIIAEFRKRNEDFERGKVLRYKYIPALSAAVSVLLLIVVMIFSDNNNEEEYLDFNSLNENEIENAGSDYALFDDINSIPESEITTINQKIDSVFAEDLLFEEDGGYYVLSELNSIIASLSYEETEDIYNSIINKNIINGDL